MRIDLTREQYTLLAELVYLGNWMVNAHRDPDDLIEKYDDMGQLFFSFSKRLVNYGLIRYYDRDDSYGPGAEMEASLHELIDEYDDETLWDELGHALSFRDLREQKKEMTFENLLPVVDRYFNEFEKNGVGRVRVDWDQADKL